MMLRAVSKRSFRTCRLESSWAFAILFLTATAVCSEKPATVAEGKKAAAPVFEKDVLPIFTRYCFNCHGKSSPQLGLELRTARLVMRGSQNGPVIVKGSLEKSLLWQKISTRQMPLAEFKLKLKDTEIETVRRWILGGALSRPSMAIPPEAGRQLALFKNKIQPIFTQRCVSCHGEDVQEAGLDLRTIATTIKGSRRGPVLVEGESGKSILIRKLVSHSMPPKDDGPPLTAKQIRLLSRWIDRGHFVDFVDLAPVRNSFLAPEHDSISEEARKFWAFQPPRMPPLPVVQSLDRVRTPIDRFILARLENKGLSLSADAGKRSLLRRVYVDLTGLLPTPAEAKAFLSDRRPDAYERLIDRLLASPRYGERWGRHWLDSVGYVDTTGKDFNPQTASLSDGFWRYRDYVIKATNDDMPWNRFLVEQIAGDELVDWRSAKAYSPQTVRRLVATGYLRNVLDATNEDISNLPFDRYEAMFKLMERVTTSTLALTMSCARCHDHKFDPIPQSDYYRFLSIFSAAYNPASWLQPKRRFLYSISKAEQAKRTALKKALTDRVADLQRQQADLRDPYRRRLRGARLKRLPAQIRTDVGQALATPAKGRSAVQKYLATKFAKSMAIADGAVDAALSPPDRLALGKLRENTDRLRAKMASLRLHKIQALWDVGAPPTIRVLQRGEVDFPGPPVRPGYPIILSRPQDTRAVRSQRAIGETSGLRLAFAEWLTDGRHPLTARVIVNRIWQHHFGVGIVSTPGNFGKTGGRPSHPALLDWLALRFMRGGWSAKRLHKLIMMSSVYRQSSSRRVPTHVSAAAVSRPRLGDKVDPGNRLLWRMNLRRLEAEALRDSVLLVSGEADYQMGGPPVMMKARKDGLLTVPDKGSSNGGSRRSVYLLARRTYPLTFLSLFDYPIIDVNCTRRVPSATPLQSLTMTNSKFVSAAAERLARRIESEAESPSVDSRVESAYWSVFSRPPEEPERTMSAQYVQRMNRIYAATGASPLEAERASFRQLVHMLLCSNEFLYVD